jgi:hypothetical protein
MTQTHRWSLAVVRGREVGRVYALPEGETLIGNFLKGAAGLDLAAQEGTTPRRMEARHAAITLSGHELAIRDLETPGGTFVNQRRLLSGQALRLKAGDVIQLGGVQLRVANLNTVPEPAPAPAHSIQTTAPSRQARSDPAASPNSRPLAPQAAPAPGQVVRGAGQSSPSAGGRLSIAFALAGGPSCRTWDDFLVLAAQRWNDLRDELTSGRLADFLRKIQRVDLLPRAQAGRSADEQLDDWLARLPATRSSAPELDVHPEVLTVRAVAGGGITRQSLRVTNIGYRLLRCTARVEPPGTGWLRLRPEHDGRPFFTIEQTDLPIELEIPDVVEQPLAAEIVLDSNGGVRRVGVRVERPIGIAPPVEPTSDPALPESADWARSLAPRVSRVSNGARFLGAIAGTLGLRAVAVVSNVLPPGGGSSFTEAKLSSLALIFGVTGIVFGALLGRRQGDSRDVFAAGFAAGASGLFAAAVVYALIRSVEWPLGAWSTSPAAIGVLWAAIGAGLAAISIRVIPYRPEPPESTA